MFAVRISLQGIGGKPLWQVEGHPGFWRYSFGCRSDRSPSSSAIVAEIGIRVGSAAYGAPKVYQGTGAWAEFTPAHDEMTAAYEALGVARHNDANQPGRLQQNDCR